LNLGKLAINFENKNVRSSIQSNDFNNETSFGDETKSNLLFMPQNENNQLISNVNLACPSILQTIQTP
jgi:hypothetical protein